MGFLSNLFGGNKEDKALREALAQIHRILDDEAFQLELVHPAMKAVLESAPAYDKDPNGSGPFGFTESNPIPVNGPIGQLAYLSKLETQSGQRILFHRLGAIDTVPVLGKAVKPTVVDQSFVLCPHCQQHRAQVWGDGRGGRMCRCPDCGPVAVEVADGAALTLDEDWLRTKMRLALDIESRDGIDDLGDGVWRLGDARRSPVLLARDLTRVLQEPALLERVRVAGGDVRVVTPRPRTTRGAPFGAGVEWLTLEERFTFYGGGITFIAAPPSTIPATVDPATPVNGPFSADFKWAKLPDGDGTPIRFTDGQAKVFEALWSFKGEATTAERIMQRAGLDSAKPSDLFKIKTKDKGKPEPEAQHAAYGALVVTQQRAGLYSMPCAAGALASSPHQTSGKGETFMA